MNSNSAQTTNNQPFILQHSSDLSPIPISVSSTGGKEAEPIKSIEPLQSLATELETSPEVKKAGVEVFKDSIELPPDVKKLGVAPAGSSVPVATSVALPKVVLPIPDNLVVVGLHAHVGNAVKWLAIWCVKKLKKAHVALKVIHGKIVRVKIK